MKSKGQQPVTTDGIDRENHEKRIWYIALLLGRYWPWNAFVAPVARHLLAAAETLINDYLFHVIFASNYLETKRSFSSLAKANDQSILLCRSQVPVRISQAGAKVGHFQVHR